MSAETPTKAEARGLGATSELVVWGDPAGPGAWP